MSSLYTICLDRIYGLLKEGIWKSCIPNPFADFPAKFVNELMDLPHDRRETSKICDVLLLLRSGRLTRLDLCSFGRKKDAIAKSIETIDSTSLPNLCSLSEEHVSNFVMNIITWNLYLEEFHSYIHPGLEVFLKCPNLRILKIHNSFSRFPVNSAPMDLSVLSSLRNLEVLHVFNMDAETIANVLETCPKLISFGITDSLDGLNEIAQRRQKNGLDVGRHFQLRRCVWGKESSIGDRKKRRKYNSSLPGKIRSAVEFCPLLQELIIHVHQKDGYEALRFLKQLILLKINFEFYRSEILPDIVTLLQEIGPQLKHLSIIGKEESFTRNYAVPVDVICDCCPVLESLEIWGSISVKDSAKSTSDLALKSLIVVVENTDDYEESLLFLLCKSKHLEELYIQVSDSFDDTMLSHIFERNPFSQLKVVIIDASTLTREGFQMLLKKMSSIETVLICAGHEKYFYDADRFQNVDSNDFFIYARRKMLFFRRLNEKYF